MTTTTPHPVPSHAVEAAALGWRVIPLRTDSKKPATKNWPSAASSDPDTLATWWNKWPDANYGIVTGGSGLLVVDIDGDAGHTSFDVAEAELGTLPDGLRVATPHGEHRYFIDPGGVSRGLGWRPGLDILAGKHYVVGPGSVVDGKTYTLIDDESFLIERVPALPRAWIEALRGCADGMDDGDDDVLHTRDTSPPTPNGEYGVSVVSDLSVVSGVQEVFSRFPLKERGTSHRLIFTLARHLLALFDSPPAQPPAYILDELRRWWDRGQDSTERTWGDTLAGFTDAWSRVKPGRGALAEALRAGDARGCPRVVAKMFPDPDDEPVRRLAALADELQRRAGDNPFYLAQAEAGLVLGVSRDRVGRWLRMFKSMGWLELIEPGSFAEHRASTYRWRRPPEEQHSDARAGAETHGVA